MIKKILSIIAIMSILILAGCTEEKQQTSKGIYIGGTQGITAKLEQLGVAENGVYSIFDTETFPIEVTVTNKGEYNIKPSDITLSLLGPSQSEFSDIKSWQFF